MLSETFVVGLNCNILALIEENKIRVFCSYKPLWMSYFEKL